LSSFINKTNSIQPANSPNHAPFPEA